MYWHKAWSNSRSKLQENHHRKEVQKVLWKGGGRYLSVPTPPSILFHTCLWMDREIEVKECFVLSSLTLKCAKNKSIKTLSTIQYWSGSPFRQSVIKSKLDLLGQ